MLAINEQIDEGESQKSSQNLKSNFNNILPIEIIHCIYKYLDLHGLHSALLTCKKWNNNVHSYFTRKGNFYFTIISCIKSIQGDQDHFLSNEMAITSKLSKMVLVIVELILK